MKKVTYPHHQLTIVANLYLPADFSPDTQYPAIVVVHPAGGVKEQTAGTYAKRLADNGFITLAYDAAYQGESSGEPRQHEDPYVRVGDISAAVDSLTTQAFVDNDKIGVLGICAGGGYAAAAAMADRRLKAVGGVSTVNLGQGFRYTWAGHATPESQNLIAQMAQADDMRTAQANGAETFYIPLVPTSLEGVTLPDLIEAYDYYRTPRANHPNSPSRIPLADLGRLATFDAFNLCETFLTQPLVIVAGDKANTLWFSEELYRRAGSREKSLHLIEGASHIAMYDHYVENALTHLVPFYRQHLA